MSNAITLIEEAATTHGFTTTKGTEGTIDFIQIAGQGCRYRIDRDGTVLTYGSEGDTWVLQGSVAMTPQEAAEFATNAARPPRRSAWMRRAA